jgi:hypothetical protein
MRRRRRKRCGLEQELTVKTAVLLPTFFVLALAAAIVPAHAIPTTFVSGAGSGTACTRTAPCASFANAHNATDAGGQIICLDAGDFLGASITKTITIDCSGTLGAVSSNFIINAPGATVRLRGLSIQATSSSAAAVFLMDGAALYVENCKFSSGTGFVGIQFSPQNGTAKLFVSNSAFTHMSQGIFISPVASAGAQVVVDHVRVESMSQIGIFASALQSGNGPIVVQIRDSVVAKSQLEAIEAQTIGNSVVSVTMDRSLLIHNSVGARVAGSPVLMILGRSGVISNQTGLAPPADQIYSYQNNHLRGNVNDGAVGGMLTLK